MDTIRTVDSLHLIDVERVNGIFAANGTTPVMREDKAFIDSTQFLIDDDNVLYDFHFYTPVRFTLQPPPKEVQEPPAKYPDPTVQEDTFDGNFMPQDKDFIEHQLRIMRQFGIDNNIPMNIGEWGTNPWVFIDPNTEGFDTARGGATYVQDLLELLEQHDVNFTFFSYDAMFFDWFATTLSRPIDEVHQVFLDYFSTVVSVPEVDSGIPVTLNLHQNYPNPFNPSTAISYQLSAISTVELTIYDITGRRLRTLVHGAQNAGSHAVVWNGRDDRGKEVASGIYLFRLVAAGQVQTRRMALLR